MKQLLWETPAELPQRAAEVLVATALDPCQMPRGDGRELKIITKAHS